MATIFDVIKKTGDWAGKSNRSEFWMFTIKTSLIVLFLHMIEFVMTGYWLGYTGGAISLLTFFPWLSLLIRRFNDAGISRWWALLGLIPFIGQIIAMLMACKDTIRVYEPLNRQNIQSKPYSLSELKESQLTISYSKVEAE